MKCAFCQKELPPATAAVEMVGGHIDPGITPGEADAFVIDEDVLKPAWAHLKCLRDAIVAARERK